MKLLPIGLQVFEQLLEKDCIYVDKTRYIHQLIRSGGNTFFLSRPRRFGKSLLLSTIKSVMEGKRELFEGLYIYDKIDWQPHPVILLSLSGRSSMSVEKLELSLSYELRSLGERLGVIMPEKHMLPGDLLATLVKNLREKTGKQVVLLIDEYDHPILDAINDPPRANQIREVLRTFYTVIKDISGDLRFVLLTGVSKISQVSVFSGLNNLYDITMDEDYAGICGYTQEDLEKSFDRHISLLAERDKTSKAQTIEKIRQWYNGYSWNGKIFVYNPFSTLLLFQRKEFEAFWFATGTATFLLKLMRERNDLTPVLDDEIIRSLGFADRQSLERLELVPLLFQTGYLTVKHFDESRRYHLGIPNIEVKKALTESLFAYVTDQGEDTVNVHTDYLREHLANGNIMAAIERLRSLFAGIPYISHLPYEKYYHSLFQLAVKMAGVAHNAEVMTDKGRIDSVLKFPKRTYVIEFKYSPDEQGLEQALDNAATQITDKGYHEQYCEPGKELHLLAIAFTRGKIVYKTVSA